MHPPHVLEPGFNEVVTEYHAMLYRFALSLTQKEAEACDLTQETFYVWANKRQQIRDPSKTQSWLLSTMRRLFLGQQRRRRRFPHHEISMVEHELPKLTPQVVDQMDARFVMEALLQVDDKYREALTLFYFEDLSYREIASLLEVPVGTVMSRLARGKEQIRQALAQTASAPPGSVPLTEKQHLRKTT